MNLHGFILIWNDECILQCEFGDLKIYLILYERTTKWWYYSIVIIRDTFTTYLVTKCAEPWDQERNAKFVKFREIMLMSNNLRGVTRCAVKGGLVKLVDDKIITSYDVTALFTCIPPWCDPSGEGMSRERWDFEWMDWSFSGSNCRNNYHLFENHLLLIQQVFLTTT